MRQSKAGPWVIGTVFVSLLILALAWVLAISPQIDRTATARSDADDVRAQNQIQRQRVTALKEQAAHLDDDKTELARLALGIPESDKQPELLREMDAAAVASGVTILSTAFEVPEGFFAEAALEEEEPTVQEETTEAADGESAEEAPAEETPDPIAGVAGLVVIPTQIVVLGTYDSTVAFMEALQSRLTRLYLVGSFTMTGQEEAEASGGRPATAEGDVEMTIDGFVYVLMAVDDAAEGTGGTAADPEVADAGTADS